MEINDSREIKEYNLKLFEELKYKKVIIRSNISMNQRREYLIEDIEEIYVKNKQGANIPAVRLKNTKVEEYIQPVIKLPRNKIKVKKDKDKTTLIINYVTELPTDSAFKYMAKSKDKELELYIDY